MFAPKLFINLKQNEPTTFPNLETGCKPFFLGLGWVRKRVSEEVNWICLQLSVKEKKRKEKKRKERERERKREWERERVYNTCLGC